MITTVELLSAVAFDCKPEVSGASNAFAQFSQDFFSSLHTHTGKVRKQAAKPLVITRSPGEFDPACWTIAVLPDTQYYARDYPGMFTLQTAWIQRNWQKRNMEYILHLGDIVNNNNVQQWERAAESLSFLDGLPLAIVPGNHDYGPNGNAKTRDSLFNKYCSFAKARENCFLMRKAAVWLHCNNQVSGPETFMLSLILRPVMVQASNPG